MSDTEQHALPDWLIVSRETIDGLAAFMAMLEKWNPAINLVSKSSIPMVWQRHVLDSAQMYFLIPGSARRLLDLGSGGGFPGLVLAILAKVDRPDLTVKLVESDQRKAVFLGEVIRKLELRAEVVAQRIETLAPQNADVLTARALAPLGTLCGFVMRHMATDGVALFSKGVHAAEETQQARLSWVFELETHASRSDESSSILAMRQVRHA